MRTHSEDECEDKCEDGCEDKSEDKYEDKCENKSEDECVYDSGGKRGEAGLSALTALPHLCTLLSSKQLLPFYFIRCLHVRCQATCLPLINIYRYRFGHCPSAPLILSQKSVRIGLISIFFVIVSVIVYDFKDIYHHV